MFQNYKKIYFDEENLILANTIEAKSDDLYVFWASKFNIDIDFFSLKINISKSKKFNLLEEFILKICIELQDEISIKELSEIFGLDPVFIIETVKNLLELETIRIFKMNKFSDSISLDTIISITEIGKKFYKEGCIPAPSTPLTIFGYINPIDNSFNFISSDKTLFDINKSTYTSLENISEIINFSNNINITEIDLDKWLEIFKLNNLNYQLKENERIISIKVLNVNKVKTNISLIFFYDNIKNEIKVKAKLDIEQNFNESVSNILTKYLNENLDSNKIINFENIKNYILTYFYIEGKDLFLSKYNISLKNEKKIIKVNSLDYNKEFISALENSKNSILIYIPIIHNSLFNKEIISLLKKLYENGIKILIGYGKIIYPYNELNVIFEENFSNKNNGGIILQKIVEFPLKEIIIDKKISFVEYLNYTNFNNNIIIPLGENVLKITDKKLANSRFEFWENEYLNFSIYSIGNFLLNITNDHIISSLNIISYFDKFEILGDYLSKVDEKKILKFRDFIENNPLLNKNYFDKLKNILDKLYEKYKNKDN